MRSENQRLSTSRRPTAQTPPFQTHQLQTALFRRVTSLRITALLYLPQNAFRARVPPDAVRLLIGKRPSLLHEVQRHVKPPLRDSIGKCELVGQRSA